jgi:AcrR family transcriptional regulator
MFQSGQADRPGVKQRNRKRVVDAARLLVAEYGVEALSMRALADEAGVSVTTLYNLFGTKEGIVRALAADVLEAFDARLEHIDGPDGIERARRMLDVLVDLVIDQAPRPLVAAVLGDELLVYELAAGWRSRDALEQAMRAAVDAGQLAGDLAPRALAEDVLQGFVRLQRMWAADVLSDDGFRARVLYGLYIALLADAAPAARPALLAAIRPLERRLLRASAGR